MATTDKMIQPDLLGLNRFALTESAYDLVNSLQGAYGRLCYMESQKAVPDQELIHEWQHRSKEIGRNYRRLADDDLSAVEGFIKIAAAEWKQLITLESERTLVPSHAS